MHGIKTISAIYKEMANSYLSPMQLPERLQLELLNPLLRYLQDTMG